MEGLNTKEGQFDQPLEGEKRAGRKAEPFRALGPDHLLDEMPSFSSFLAVSQEAVET